ncbi:MAG: laccase domain-containing protein [Nocardioides sp.]
MHAGRQGVAVNVVGAALDALADLAGSTGAERVVAWIGPHVCGSCYEVPDALRAEVADLVPRHARGHFVGDARPWTWVPV